MKTFSGGPIGKLKKHELEHRLALLKKTIEMKSNTPEPEAASAGAPAARDVKTETVSLEGETSINMPIAPVGGKVHSARYTKKAKDAESSAAPAEKPAKKARITAPKVVLPEEEPVIKKVVKKRVPKPAAEPAAPAAPAAAPAPAAPKLPQNVRKVVDTITLG